MKLNTNEKGFTLLELLASLIIIAIATSIAMPMFFQAKSEADMNASSEKLVQSLYFAQLKAVNQKTPTRVVLTGGATPLERSTYTWKPKGNTTLISGTQDVYFNQGGFIQTGENATNYNGIKKFVICNAPRASATMSRVITVDRIGRIRQSEILGGCTP